MGGAMMRSVGYRLGQGLAALLAGVRRLDDGPALAGLAPGLAGLYRRMEPVDRRHALAVWAWLVRAGHGDAVLLEAALLHDVGKAGRGIGVVHRTARVLLARRAPAVWRSLHTGPGGWREPFRALADHAEVGAEMVRHGGGCPELVELVRHHEKAAPGGWSGTVQGQRHAALAEADARR